MPVNHSAPIRTAPSCYMQPSALMYSSMVPGAVILVASPTTQLQMPHNSPIGTLPSVRVGAAKQQPHAPPAAQQPPFAPTTTPQTFGCGAPCTVIPLIDPTGFGGLIQVPVNRTLETRGRDEYLKGTLKKEVSLCCLYQKGRCHAQDKCHQIHVDLSFMRQIRSQNAGVVSCCRAHADTASSTPAAQAFFAAHLPGSTVSLLGGAGGVSQTIPTTEVAFTVGLQTHVAEGGSACALPLRTLCRLHLRSACKYGKDCKRIHVCSKLGEGLLDESVSAPKSTPNSQRASARQSPAPAPVHVRMGSTESSETPRLIQTPPPSARSSSSTPGTDCVFSPVFLRSPATRRNSLGSDDAGSVGPATPPPLECVVKAAPVSAGSAECPALTLDAVERMGASSFLEHSFKVQGLCFDPLLLCERDTDLWTNQPSSRTNVSELFDQSVECGALSTTSFSPSRPASVWL